MGAVVLPPSNHGPGPDVIAFLSERCLLVVAIKQSDVVVSASDNSKNRQTTNPDVWWPDWRGKGKKHAKGAQTKQKSAWRRLVHKALVKHEIGLLIRVGECSYLIFDSFLILWFKLTVLLQVHVCLPSANNLSGQCDFDPNHVVVDSVDVEYRETQHSYKSIEVDIDCTNINEFMQELAPLDGRGCSYFVDKLTSFYEDPDSD